MEEASMTKEISHCLIHVGSNHTSIDPPHALASKLLAFLKEVRSNMPKTAIHFSGILPKFGQELLPGISYVNSKVQRNQHLIGYSYIDHPNFIWNDKLICKDGIHPSFKGVAQLAMDFKK